MRKTVLITGCSSGIGLALAKGLSKQGYDVIASARYQPDVDRLNDDGIKAVKLDLDDSDSISDGFNKALELANGKIFALINNGAYGQPGAVEDLTRKALKRQFETNVFGTQELTNLVIPVMRKQGTGRIIQISSVLGIICLRFRGAYNASKYALEALTDTMRLELAGTGIQFSLVEPGPVESKFRENALAKFKQHIDEENSVFSETYEKVERRLKTEKNARFTLPASAVLDVCIHALSARRPKIRYRVTTPTKIMAPLKRFLPDRLMDRFLLKSGDSDD